jgi:hypothetical protein
MRLETTNLSLGGCYIQLIMALSLGARVQVTLWLAGRQIHVFRAFSRPPKLLKRKKQERAR